MSLSPTVDIDVVYASVEIASNGATVTVNVPEIAVDIAGVGPQGPAGTGADGYILQAYDSTDQMAASTTVAYPIRLGTVDISDGITVEPNGSSDPTQITFNNDGDYNIQFSIQFINTSASEAQVNVWFRKNGVDIADSNSQITVPKKHGSDDGALILALNLIVSVGAGDYAEIYWQTESTNVSIQALPAGTTPTTPATPSVILTAMVNRYLEPGPTGPTGPQGPAGVARIASSYSTTTISNSAAETNLLSQGITGAAEDLYQLIAWGEMLNNTGGSVTFQFRAKLGSTTMLTSTQAFGTSADKRFWRYELYLPIVSTTSQRANGQLSMTTAGAATTLSFGAIYTGNGTASEDVSTSKNLILSGQMNTASANATISVTGWYLTKVSA